MSASRRLALAAAALAASALSACGSLPPLPFLGPTPTPTATLTPTPTFTPTASPTPSPTPTPVPAARIEAADRAMWNGDWERAVSEYQTALAQSDEPAVRAAAQLGLGRARLSASDYGGAVNELLAFLQQFSDSPQAPDANFLLGEAYYAAGNWEAAADAYGAYLAARPNTIDSYVQERLAEAAFARGAYDSAEQAYIAAIDAPRVGGPLDLRERLAALYVAAGNAEAALAQYDAIYQATNQDARRARAYRLAGDLFYALGRTDEAYGRYLDLVNNYPSTGDAFAGLLVLVNDGVAVNDLMRGLTNYHARNYEPALAAFDRYLAADPPPDSAATALYHKGQTLHELRRDADAILVFRDLVARYPGSPFWTQAYRQIAFIQPYPDDVQTFQDFVRAAPGAPEAPDSLYRAARLDERNGNFGRAAELWTRIAVEYPASAQAADSAMQAGLVLFRAGQLSPAAQRFELAATLGGDREQHARAWLWIGKLRERAGDLDGARAAWQTAAAIDPTDYYSIRADQLMRGEAPFTAGGFNFAYDAAREREEAEAWMRAQFPQAQTVSDLTTLGPGIWQEARFVRGAELWRLGRFRQAHAEFDSLRRDLLGDPIATYQLALYFHSIGAYDLSIRNARQVLDLAGLSNSFLGPRYFQRLRYPAPFADLVVPAGQQYGLHPFLMYSKMRIESFFWKFAISSAEARGLNQIIPPTANDIAARLSLAGFVQDDLYRPIYSVPMGAFYLDFVRRATAPEPGALLAGYYAGPGNADIWLRLADGDPDLFVEVIRLPDAKGYVQTTFEYFWVYNWLYGE